MADLGAYEYLNYLSSCEFMKEMCSDLNRNLFLPLVDDMEDDSVLSGGKVR